MALNSWIPHYYGEVGDDVTIVRGSDLRIDFEDGTVLHLNGDSAETETVGTGYVMPQNTITFNVTIDPAELDRLNEWVAQVGPTTLREYARQVYQEYLCDWYTPEPRLEYHTGYADRDERPVGHILNRPVCVDEAIGDGYVRLRHHDNEMQIWNTETGNPYKNPAVEKAEELLLLCLKEHQVETYQEWGYFDVTGSAGGRYRIHNWYRSYNVLDLFSRSPYDGDGAYYYYDRYCALPMQGERMFPLGDQLLAQKLTIETDEQEFLKTANPSRDVINEIERFGCIFEPPWLK